MQETKLGNSQITIPQLCVGTWAWGNNWISDNEASMSDLNDVFQNAVTKGIDFFDTAEVYGNGNSEKILGELMRRNSKKVRVASKFNPRLDRQTDHPMEEALKGSLKRLNLDAISLYYIHVVEMESNIEKWVNQLGDVYKEGLVDAVGVSNYHYNNFLRAYELLDKRGIHLSAVQVHYSLINREHEFSGLLDECKKLGVAFFGYMPLAQGLLTGKYSKDKLPRGMIREQLYCEKTFDDIERLLATLKSIGNKYGKAPAQIALNWVMSKGIVPIVGARDKEQIIANIESTDLSLSAEEIEVLDEMTKSNTRDVINVPWDANQ